MFLFQWSMSLLPASFFLFIAYTLLIAGLVLYAASKMVRFVPFMGQYRLPAELAGIAAIVIGVFLYGGHSIEMAWRARVAEMEAKVAKAEEQAKKANAEIGARVAAKTREIKEKGKTRVEYINRLVEGRTVEIVKDMSEQERQAFLAKQRELQDAVKNCPVPRIIIEEHNKAAQP
jgi:hypothetical protein